MATGIILWDRLFGTYCGDETVGQIGAGTGKPLSIREQLAALAFTPQTTDGALSPRKETRHTGPRSRVLGAGASCPGAPQLCPRL